MSGHTGNHIDDQLPFTVGSASIDEVAVETLVCPLAIVGIQGKAYVKPDAQVTPDDLDAWTAGRGPIS